MARKTVTDKNRAASFEHIPGLDRLGGVQLHVWSVWTRFWNMLDICWQPVAAAQKKYGNICLQRRYIHIYLMKIHSPVEKVAFVGVRLTGYAMSKLRRK